MSDGGIVALDWLSDCDSLYGAYVTTIPTVIVLPGLVG